jgi:hypothetical protein
MLQIEERSAAPSLALFELGFRPLFTGAGLFAVLAILLRMAIYVFALRLAPAGRWPPRLNRPFGGCTPTAGSSDRQSLTAISSGL